MFCTLKQIAYICIVKRYDNTNIQNNIDYEGRVQ